MNVAFADTFYYLALVSPDDAAHELSVEYSRTTDMRVVTTAWILTEVADALSAPVNRRSFQILLDALRADELLTILPPSSELFERGLQLFRDRPDKDWPLTDCISFVAMREHRIQEALTADRHFEQAGFVALLK